MIDWRSAIVGQPDASDTCPPVADSPIRLFTAILLILFGEGAVMDYTYSS